MKTNPKASRMSTLKKAIHSQIPHAALCIKKAAQSGKLRGLAFSLSVTSLLAAFLVLFLFGAIFYDVFNFVPLVTSLLLLGFALQIITHLLPSPKLHRPKALLQSGTDTYLDQKDGQFSSEERETLLQESWIIQAERFLRIRKF